MNHFQQDNDEITQAKKDELRMIFQRATNHLTSIRGDLEHQVSKYWATVEADRFHSMDEARKIWSSLMQELGDNADHWLEYINLEKMYGDTKHLRRLFLRALERTHDQPERISQAWLQFEREESSLEQFEECERKIKARMIGVISKRNEERSKKDIYNKKDNKKFLSAGGKNTQERNDNSRKRTHQIENEQKSKVSEPVFKKPNLSIHVGQSSAGDVEKTISGSVRVPPPPGFKQVLPPPGYNATSSNNIDKSQGSIVKGKESDTTVFVSNLDFSTTEQQIRNCFATSGTIEEVRLVKNYAGKSKGFAYVTFSFATEAKHALGRDKELLCGRPVYVSEHNPDKKASGVGHQFKFSTGIEKNKLYVKNLPQTTTKVDLENLFSPFGKLKDVRLITYRNGHSKGIAYVEYQSDSSASKALVQTDGMKIEDNEISVAISNPPAKKDVQKHTEVVTSLGSVSQDNLGGYRGKGRSQVAFVPRSVQKNATVIKESRNGSNIKEPEKSAKSNADFRNMLLNNK